MSTSWPFAEQWSSMNRYKHTDILRSNKDEVKKTKEEMPSENDAIKYAIENRYPVIVQGSWTGQWYFKGKGYSHNSLEGMIKENEGKYDSCYVILIKFE